MVTDTKIRLAILDFDGTIADTQTLIVDTMQGVIEELGLEKRTRAQCAAMIGLPLEKTFSTLIPMSDEMMVSYRLRRALWYRKIHYLYLGSRRCNACKASSRTCTENAARAALYPRRGISRGRYRLRH